MKFHLLLLATVFSLSAVYAQNSVKGIIYHDMNKNGKRDKNEKGIPNVSVSNGVQVVQSNHKGEYTLSVGNDNIIFVIKPSDYAYPTNEKNLPQFYHIHKPLGSPELKYAGSKPTGKLPKSLDFALYHAPENRSFKAFVFGDPQVYNLDEVNYFEKGIVQDIKDKSQFSFGISLGDLVGNHLELHQPYIDAISKIGLPWYNVIGNHDLNFDVTADSLSDETFERNFGPANYAFNYGDAHVIILDDILYPHPKTGSGYQGGFRPDQLDFIANNLKFVPKDKLIVLAFHIPLSSSMRAGDRQRLFDILAEYPNTVSMSAHTHYQKQIFYTQADGWKQEKPHHEYNVGTTSGDWYSGAYNAQGVPASTMRDGTPKGYAILNVNGNQYSFDYKVAGESEDYQIKIAAPTVMSKKHVRRFTVYANFFMGKHDDTVEFRLNDGKWQKMTPVNIFDPNYAYEMLKFDNAEQYIKGRRPSDPVNSTHLWSIKMPNAPLGEHKLEIRAIDMFGKEHKATKTIQIED